MCYTYKNNFFPFNGGNVYEEEKDCFERMKKGDKTARNSLIEHNLRLVAHIIKKYYSNSAEQDDLVSIGTIGLIKAVSTFNYEKGTRFATYAARCIENEILMHIRAQRKHKCEVSLNEPIGTDADGHTYNVNADIAAGKIASALGAMKLFLLTDVEGLYRDFNDKSSLITRLTADEVSELVKAGAIKKGMIPKLESCVNAINAGVENVHIIDGRVPHSLLLELFTDSGVGTMMTKGESHD